jgi:hypothetical protein
MFVFLPINHIPECFPPSSRRLSVANIRVIELKLHLSVTFIQCDTPRKKTVFRATMGDEKLSNLSLLHIHRTRNLSVEDVINKFAVRKNRRLDFI